MRLFHGFRYTTQGEVDKPKVGNVMQKERVNKVFHVRCVSAHPNNLRGPGPQNFCMEMCHWDDFRQMNGINDGMPQMIGLFGGFPVDRQTADPDVRPFIKKLSNSRMQGSSTHSQAVKGNKL